MRRVLTALVLLVLLAAGLPAQAVPIGGGTPMAAGYAFYPRVIRLAHQAQGNGMLVAALVTNNGKDWVGAIHHSTDNGLTFTKVGEANDPENIHGMCCHTLYELPQAVGAMPAGTLLWAASMGADAGAGRQMSEHVWKSADQGRTWTFLAEVDKSPSSAGTWEPEFTVTTDGRLVMFYSDETDGVHSQKLVEHATTDGVNWTGPRDVVALADTAARPGMAVVRKVPDGSYLMSYEICGPGHNCEAYVRWSTDGWNWGAPTDAGSRVRTADGRYPGSTPTITVVGNTVVLNSMRVRNADGSFAAGDGRMFFGNAASGHGDWFEMTAPVQIPDPGNGVCPTWSNPLLGSADGKSVFQIATDYDAGGLCRAWPGAGAAVPVGSRSAAESGRVLVTQYQQHLFATASSGTLRHWFWDSRDGMHSDTWGTAVAGQPVGFLYGEQQHVFWRSTSGTLEHSFWDPASGSYHDTWGTGLAGDPAALVNGNAQHTWAVDASGNLQHSWWAPGQAVQHNTWGGGVAGRPSALLVQDAEHIVVRTTDGRIRHTWWTGPQGFQSETIGSNVTGDPVTTQLGDAHHIWATTSNGELRHWWWNAREGWRTDVWSTGAVGRPAFLQVGDAQHVWHRTTTGDLIHVCWSPSTGLVRETWGTGITGDPTATSVGSAQHVWSLDAANAAQHWWTEGATVRHDTWG